MLDISSVTEGLDLGTANSAAMKAGNVLAVQLGALEFAPTFGVDLKFFLSSDFSFQNESFKAYLVERLTQHQVDVSTVVETIETLFRKFTFSIENKQSIDQGLIQ
jgi:hypothetical protein